MTLSSLSRLYWTVRPLRPIQIYDRVRRRLLPVRPPKRIESVGLRTVAGRWVQSPQRPATLEAADRMRVFERTYSVATAADWNADLPAVVRYNLHYFDDLNARDSDRRVAWHRALMERWIQQNPPGQGVGWDPYPLSLRIVNWLKWYLAGNPLTDAMIDSLALQVDSLTKQLEYHLLGNHLLANAKALVFAGCCLSGRMADRWRDLGLELWGRELAEQILPDGGHFELSPMYHSLILEDLLDLINLGSAYPELDLAKRLPNLRPVAQRMRGWLAVMTHPDGQISFFNDAAHGVAVPPAKLQAYASRLQLPDCCQPRDGLNPLPDSGYFRLQQGPAVAIIDVAHVGPSYQPGHAHADTLSFELSLGEQRVIVNSGTSCYGVSQERQRQRSTAAHSTVEVDGQSSSEVWSGFRVARRAVPHRLRISDDQGKLDVACQHDGYRRLSGRVTHRRRWQLMGDQLRVEDHLEGQFQRAIARFYFHPQMNVMLAEHQSPEALPSGATGTVRGADWVLSYRIENGDACCVESTYHPAFDRSVANSCLKSIFLEPVHSLLISW